MVLWIPQKLKLHITSKPMEIFKLGSAFTLLALGTSTACLPLAIAFVIGGLAVGVTLK
jgi:hypothetical protein